MVVKRDCQYWSQDSDLEVDDLADEGIKENVVLKCWTEKTLSTEASNYHTTLIARSELYFRGKVQEKADSTVEVHLWRRKKVIVKFATLDILTKDSILYLRKEASVAIALRHTNVVKHYGVTIDPPRLGLVLEYCRYGDLFGVLQVSNAEDCFTDSDSHY